MDPKSNVPPDGLAPALNPAPPGTGKYWSRPKPDVLPRPTYWPVVLAFGLTMAGWGVLTSLLIAGTGTLVSAIAIVKWIQELRHEQER